MAKFLSEEELYPLVQQKSAKARNVLWICSPYLGTDARRIFSQEILKNPPRDIRFIFRLNDRSVKRKEVNPYEMQYFLDHFKDSDIRTNNTFHAKIYIFDNSALVTSANLTKAGFQNNIEAGVLLERSEVEKAKDFFKKLWRNSVPLANLDDYKYAWRKSRTKGDFDNHSPKAKTKAHTRIKPWNDDVMNRWFIQVEGNMKKKTENKIIERTNWTNLGLMAGLHRKTYGGLKLGDIIYIHDLKSKGKSTTTIEESQLKDKRVIRTGEGLYHLGYEEKRVHRVKKSEFDNWLKIADIRKYEDALLDGKRLGSFNQLLSKKRKN